MVDGKRPHRVFRAHRIRTILLHGQRSTYHGEQEMSENCLFCKMVSGAIKPDLVYQDDKVLAFRDINPQAPTHILVIPKRHFATLNELRDEDVELAGRLLLTARRIAKEAGLAEAGYRTVMNTNADAGQTVFHVHLHLLGGRRMQWPPG